MKKRVWLKYFVNDCLWKRFLPSNLSHTASNLICLTILVTVRHLTQSQPLKLKQQSCKAGLRFVLLDNYFSDHVTENKLWYWKSFSFGLEPIFRKIKYIPANIWLVLTIGSVNKDIKSKRKFCIQSLETFLWF